MTRVIRLPNHLISPRRKGIDERTVRWIARNPWTAVLLFGWSVMLAYGVVYGLSGAWRA